MRFVNSLVLAGTAIAIAVAAAPAAAADNQQSQQQYCVTSPSASKCVKPGNAEINASIPAPPAGPWSIYGPFWGGN
jgi:hypothetical protein